MTWSEIIYSLEKQTEPVTAKAIGECLRVVECCCVVDFVFFGEQTGHVGSCEFFILELVPKVGSTLVHADHLREVDVFLSFSDENAFAADFPEIKSFFCFHIVLVSLFLMFISRCVRDKDSFFIHLNLFRGF